MLKLALGSGLKVFYCRKEEKWKPIFILSLKGQSSIIFNKNSLLLRLSTAKASTVEFTIWIRH